MRSVGGLETQQQRVRESSPQQLHGLRRSGKVGEGGLDPGCFMRGQGWVGQQVVEATFDARQLAGDRCGARTPPA